LRGELKNGSSGYFTIRITEQNSSGTIELFSMQKTSAHRGRKTSPNFGEWIHVVQHPGTESDRLKHQHACVA
jgi:hypothetical protein